MRNPFSGTGVAVVTPFHKQGTIDFTSLSKILQNLIDKNVDYIVALGTTSESPTLSHKEKVAVVEFTLETVNNKVPIVLGMGGNNTLDIVEELKGLPTEGLSGILSVAPYYNKPSQQGIYLHFKSISDVSPLPIILYNIPGRTGVNMTAETTLRIANDMDNVVAIKEASCNLTQIMDIIRQRPKGFSVLSGEDALTLPIIAMGGDGVISVAANAFPAEFSKMVNLALEGKIEEARKIHYDFIPIFHAIFEEGNPTGIKAVLEIMKFTNGSLRLPLIKASKPLHNKLNSLVTEFLNIYN